MPAAGWTSACQDYDQALAGPPADRRGIAYSIKGEYVRAIQSFDQALRLDVKMPVLTPTGDMPTRRNGPAMTYALRDYDQAPPDPNQRCLCRPGARLPNSLPAPSTVVLSKRLHREAEV